MRLIKEIVTAARRKAISDLGSKMSFPEPIIVVMKPNNDTLSIHGEYSLDKFINIDKIPISFDNIRLLSVLNSGVVYTNESSIIVRVFSDQPIQFIKLFNDAILTLIPEAKISTHRPSPNDFISFQIDTDKLKELFKLDSEKIKARGLVTDISQVIGGINEINPLLTESIVDDIINLVALKMKITLENSSFTSQEETILKTL